MELYEKTLAWWKEKKIETDAQLAEVLNGHSIAFAYHSGKIENNKITYNDTREIFENDGVTAYTGDLRTLFEIRNAKLANELFLTSFGEKRRMDEALVKEFQKLLTMNTYDARRWQLGERPGEYKKQENALTAVAYFHVKFENIHPFADGNGRTGRLAMNYLLVMLGHPPIVVHEEDRKEYYAALEAWDTKQNLKVMISFLRSQTMKTWRKRVEKLK